VQVPEGGWQRSGLTFGGSRATRASIRFATMIGFGSYLAQAAIGSLYEVHPDTGRSAAHWVVSRVVV